MSTQGAIATLPSSSRPRAITPGFDKVRRSSESANNPDLPVFPTAKQKGVSVTRTPYNSPDNPSHLESRVSNKQ